MNVDRVARAMTDGKPTSTFTARVMAPLHGRPRPDFTARVMSRLDQPAAGGSFSSGIGRAVILVPAAVAIAAGAVVLRSSRVTLPPAPDAPRIVAALGVPSDAASMVALGRPAPTVTLLAHSKRSVRAIQQPQAATPSIYMIDALDAPADITMKSIGPAPSTIPALDGPAPLTVTDLPGTPVGSGSRNSKEKS